VNTTTAKRAPNKATIKKVFEWLAEQGLDVYGPTMDTDGCEYPSQMDYTFEEAINRANHIKNGTLIDMEDL
jgi:hypothetical protein